jgi:hypothetical protein
MISPVISFQQSVFSGQLTEYFIPLVMKAVIPTTHYFFPRDCSRRFCGGLRIWFLIEEKPYFPAQICPIIMPSCFFKELRRLEKMIAKENCPLAWQSVFASGQYFYRQKSNLSVALMKNE